MTNPTSLALGITERGLIPDSAIRRSIRYLVRQRLNELPLTDCETQMRGEAQFIKAMDQAPIALVPELANEQHYEVPAEFYSHVLGPHRKYSSSYWPVTTSDLKTAEEHSLRSTCEHAELENGQQILELGCGWGSLTLWMATHYPNSQITGVSNSQSQRFYILQEARNRGLQNIEIITADMNDFSIDRRFDRVVSVEMFEHMRNYRILFSRICNWLTDEGKFFMHIFCHRSTAYEFLDNGPSDWMSRHFFSGGIMPSDSLPLHFQDDLILQNQWRWDGTHYEKTANAWLANMDKQREQIMPILKETYGEENRIRWWMRWHIFFMACAELFGYNQGQEWWVSHYLFKKRAI